MACQPHFIARYSFPVLFVYCPYTYNIGYPDAIHFIAPVIRLYMPMSLARRYVWTARSCSGRLVTASVLRRALAHRTFEHGGR